MAQAVAQKQGIVGPAAMRAGAQACIGGGSFQARPRDIWLRSTVRWRADTPISSAMRQTMLSSSSWFLSSAKTTCHIMRMISIRSSSGSWVMAEVKR